MSLLLFACAKPLVGVLGAAAFLSLKSVEVAIPEARAGALEAPLVVPQAAQDGGLGFGVEPPEAWIEPGRPVPKEAPAEEKTEPAPAPSPKTP